MTVTIDLSNYKDRRGSRVPEDTYKVQIIDAEMSQSSNGNDMINVIFEIIEGEYKGSTLVDRYVQTERGLFRTVGLLQGIGMPTPRKRLQLRMESLLNKVLYVDVSDGEPYNGTIRSEVRGWGRAEQAEARDIDDLGDEEETETEQTLPLSSGGSKGEPEPTATEASDDEEVDLDTIEL